MSDETTSFDGWLEECVKIRAALLKSAFANDPVSYPIILEKAIRPFFYYTQSRNGEDRKKETPAPTPQPSPVPRRDPGGTTKVEVFRTQFKHAPAMKEWKLRWRPEDKAWWGSVPTEALQDFLKYCKGIGLEVHY